MSWRVVVRTEAGDDVAEAADWYDERSSGLGDEFIKEVLKVFDALTENPLLNSRRHPRKNIRWRYPDRFPYRVIYQVLEEQQTVIIAAVLHAARHGREWKKRV
jgi:plasmid stabilization system protein ParE